MSDDGLLAKAVIVVLFLVIVLGGVYCNCVTWNECRSSGHSRLYCYHLVGR